MFWWDSVGADHGGLMLRAENRDQLRLVHDELGFEYVRFHGIFADDTDVYSEANGHPAYDFETVDRIYDTILKAGMKPFVEISFMPHELATSERTIFYWKANGSPPRDYAKWSALVAAFARHLEDRFGKAEVESWRFEVWNEPNLDGFWTGGDRDAYFRLYDATAGAIKAVDPLLCVGGPATAGAAWVPELIAHTESSGTPLDFISTHTYGVVGGFLDENGDGDNKLSTSPGSVVDDVLAVRRQVQASQRPGLPVYFTEWSTSYNPRDPIHDAYLSAAFVLDKLKGSQGAVQSMSYWTYTDLFEEAGPPPAAFHGGFGLVNREGLRKPVYFAYKYLNALGPDLLRSSDAHSWITRDGGDFAALIWDYTLPDQDESDRPYFRKLQPAAALPPVRLSVSALRPGKYRLTLHRVGFEANDAYSQYIKWGLPKDLSPEQLTQLRRLSDDRPEAQSVVDVGPSRRFERSVPMRTNDVVFVTLRAIAEH